MSWGIKVVVFEILYFRLYGKDDFFLRRTYDKGLIRVVLVLTRSFDRGDVRRDKRDTQAST